MQSTPRITSITIIPVPRSPTPILSSHDGPSDGESAIITAKPRSMGTFARARTRGRSREALMGAIKSKFGSATTDEYEEDTIAEESTDEMNAPEFRPHVRRASLSRPCLPPPNLARSPSGLAMPTAPLDVSPTHLPDVMLELKRRAEVAEMLLEQERDERGVWEGRATRAEEELRSSRGQLSHLRVRLSRLASVHAQTADRVADRAELESSLMQMREELVAVLEKARREDRASNTKQDESERDAQRKQDEEKIRCFEQENSRLQAELLAKCRENSRILSSLQTHRSDLARLRDECASRAEQCLSLSQRLSVTQTALAARSAALKETLHAWKQCKIELSKATREAESYKAEADDAKKMAKGEQLRGREKSKVEAEALSAALVRIRSLERRENHLQTLLRERGNELQECRKMLKEKGTELELVVAKHETRNEVSSESKLSATPMTVGPTSPQTSFESRGTQATIVSDHNEGACPRCRHCRSALKKQRATEEEVAARAAEIAATILRIDPSQLSFSS